MSSAVSGKLTDRIGIMQGRLSPPINGRIQAFPSTTWREEFTQAASCGLACIEWIYEASSESDNPFSTQQGIQEMRKLAGDACVAIRSLCADYLIEQPLFGTAPGYVQSTWHRILWMLHQCVSAGIQRIVLPFVAANAIRNEKDLSLTLDLVDSWTPIAEQSGVEIHLETSLGPREYVQLLDRLPYPVIKVNYDIGNSLQFGFDARDELDAYGDRIGSVHVKDSQRHGTTVPLGAGDADFRFVFRRLAELGYRGDFILQAAREPRMSEADLTRQYRDFLIRELTAAESW